MVLFLIQSAKLIFCFLKKGYFSHFSTYFTPYKGSFGCMKPKK